MEKYLFLFGLWRGDPLWWEDEKQPPRRVEHGALMVVKWARGADGAHKPWFPNGDVVSNWRGRFGGFPLFHFFTYSLPFIFLICGLTTCAFGRRRYAQYFFFAEGEVVRLHALVMHQPPTVNCMSFFLFSVSQGVVSYGRRERQGRGCRAKQQQQ